MTDGLLKFVGSLPWDEVEPIGLLALGLYAFGLWVGVPFLVLPYRRGNGFRLAVMLGGILGLVFLLEPVEIGIATQDLWVVIFGGKVESKRVGLVHLLLTLPLLLLALELEVMTFLDSAYALIKTVSQPKGEADRNQRGKVGTSVAVNSKVKPPLSTTTPSGASTSSLGIAPEIGAIQQSKKANQDQSGELEFASTAATSGKSKPAQRTSTPAAGGRRK